ncbi:rRNA-processing protein and EBNA1-binding protein ebp2 [Allomyces javanicus]|nr:rRNA-processing protein and EBNA1-binding protein ebp2 [Allomyces javanicus]
MAATAAPTARDGVNNEKGLLAALAEFAFPSGVPFIECVAHVSAAPTSIADIHDDLKRELAFHNQALASVIAARKQILAAKVPFSRPEDYFAEMVKTDAHMARIRTKLIEETASVKKSEEVKRLRDQKKFGKQVQAEVLKERKAKEKALAEKVTDIKKKRKLEQAKDTAFEDDLDIAIMSDDDDVKPARKKTKTAKPLPNSKRMAKNVKYGHGGKKSGSKRNTAESAADFTFSTKDQKKKGFGGAKPKGYKAPRPGKSKRQNSKK